MKRLLFSLGIIFFATGGAMAQKLQYGIKGGLGFASQSIQNPDILSKNGVTTFNLAGYVDLPLKKEFYLQAGVGVLGKGVKEFQNEQTNTITLTYLDIPVTIVRKFALPTLGKIYVGAGPYAAIGLSGTNQLESINNISGNDIVFGNSDDYKKLDFGANIAAGIELNNHLTFNMKYSLGLYNIASSAPTDINTTSVKNRTFLIGIGFWL